MKHSNNFRKHSQDLHGFTLLELLVVIAILGILAAIAIPMYQGYVARGYKTTAVNNLEILPVLMEQKRSLDGWLCSNCADDTAAGANNNYTYAYTEDNNGNIVTQTLTTEYPNFKPKPDSEGNNPILYHYQVQINVTCAAAGACTETAALTATAQENRGAPEGDIVINYN